MDWEAIKEHRFVSQLEWDIEPASKSVSSDAQQI